MLLRFGRVPPRDNSKRASARVALHCLLLFAAPYRQGRPEQFARAHGQIHGPGNRRKASNAQDRVVASHLTTALILPKKWKTCWQRNTKGNDSLPGGRRVAHAAHGNPSKRRHGVRRESPRSGGGGCQFRLLLRGLE